MQENLFKTLISCWTWEKPTFNRTKKGNKKIGEPLHSSPSPLKSPSKRRVDTLQCIKGLLGGRGDLFIGLGHPKAS